MIPVARFDAQDIARMYQVPIDVVAGFTVASHGGGLLTRRIGRSPSTWRVARCRSGAFEARIEQGRFSHALIRFGPLLFKVNGS